MLFHTFLMTLILSPACRMSASSAAERDEWLQCINDSIREHPFHDIVAAKKASLQKLRSRNR